MKQCIQENNFNRIDNIIDELCRDYTYALHQPIARNAGLMGLAATAIALGTNDVGNYLRKILPPVLTCFSDQNDQVRFYACESLYNIAKIAKGEILVFFNEIFDVLCKISSDTETSIRGAAELLNRLIKDIVAEKAVNYIRIVNIDPKFVKMSAKKTDPITGNTYQEIYEQENNKLAFSLPKFIPLLTERIYAINPDTRIFLVDWINILLNVPGLEMISYLPLFLGGLFTFLGDSHKDVRIITTELLNSLLHEVVRINQLQINIKKKELIKLKNMESLNTPQAKKQDGSLIAEKKKTLLDSFNKLTSNDQNTTNNGDSNKNNDQDSDTSILDVNGNNTDNSFDNNNNNNKNKNNNNDDNDYDNSDNDQKTNEKTDDENHNSIKDHNNNEIDPSLKVEMENAIQKQNIISMTDIDEINPDRNGEEYMPGQDVHLNFSDIISILVNNLASSEKEIKALSLHWMDTIILLAPNDLIPFYSKILSVLLELLSDSNEEIVNVAKSVNEKLLVLCDQYDHLNNNNNTMAYGSIVNTLTLQFFDSDVDAKIACLNWLSLIYQKVPKEIMDHNDSMFLTLLNSLSNKDNKLIEKALNLLQKLCSDSNNDYLKKFLQDFMGILKRDPKLLKSRANYIMRKICASLSPDRVFKVITTILNSNDDILFTKIFIQILSTNLITAPEMFSLRKHLRNGDDPLFFNFLFKSWCINPVSVISLGLISESYELVYYVIQELANYELKLNDLVQLDILVQLFESPVFTRMRLQLLEQQKNPFLYKCLYGILMILPQSKAFELLNRRLNSCNIWASQPINNHGPFYSHRNISGSISSANSDPDISQRSVTQNKLRVQELLDHFSKTISKNNEDNINNEINESYNVQNNEFKDHAEASSLKDLDLPIIGSYLDVPENRSFHSITPLMSTATKAITEVHTLNHSFEEPTDSSSVLYRPPNNGGAKDKLEQQI